MLTARNGSRAFCSSCTSKLQLLFDYGFATITPLHLLVRYQRLPVQPRRLSVRISHRKCFSTSKARFKSEFGVEESSRAVASIEEVVRHARQTFRDTLPKDFLTDEEYLLYERLYGPPIRETRGEDFDPLLCEETGESVGQERAQNVLLRKNRDGELEGVDFDGDIRDGGEGNWGYNQTEEGEIEDFRQDVEDIQANAARELLELPGLPSQEVAQINVRSQRELDAILRLQRDMDVVAARPVEQGEGIGEKLEEKEEEEEEIEEEEYEDDENQLDAHLGSDFIRTHPHTMAGRFGTSPRTIQLPQEQLVIPITELLARTNNKHLTEAAERAFGGPGLPFSTSTPTATKNLQQKHIGLEAGQHRMSEIEADAYIAAVIPGMYSSVMSTLVEVRKRLGSSWIRNLLSRNEGEGPRVLDAGAGGAGLIAWREVLATEWEVFKSEGLAPEGAPVPEGKSTVLTGPSTLRHRMSRFLENTSFLPRLPDYVHSANPEALLDGAPAEGRKSYDIIIAPHTLLPLKEDHRRKHAVRNLWSLLDPNGGVLILIEKGLPRGFEAIAGARAQLLKNNISSPGSTHTQTPTHSEQEQFVAKEEGMIIAPCTNHSQCPMYKVEGLNPGRKDFCHFRQRFERPGFLQKILKANKRNHEDLKFTYLAVRRGVDLRQLPITPMSDSTSDGILSVTHTIQGEEATKAAFAGYEDGESTVTLDRSTNTIDHVPTPPFSTFALPRTILPPLKRRGHVTLDLCTPSGTLERWTVPKSFSVQAYRDARKSSHGDLWALGAKTRILREARLGKKGAVEVIRKGKGGKKARRFGKGKKKNVFEVEVGEEGMEGIRELREGKVDRSERRTKGGRVAKDRKEIGLDEF